MITAKMNCISCMLASFLPLCLNIFRFQGAFLSFLFVCCSAYKLVPPWTTSTISMLKNRWTISIGELFCENVSLNLFLAALKNSCLFTFAVFPFQSFSLMGICFAILYTFFWPLYCCDQTGASSSVLLLVDEY